MLQKNVTNLTVKTCYLDLFLLLPLGLLKFSSSFFFLIILFIYFWLCWVFVATLRLCLVAASRGPLVTVRRLLVLVASLVAEHRL